MSTPKFSGPQTFTCRACGHVLEVRHTDEPYLEADDPRLCQHITEQDVPRIEGLRLTDDPTMRIR